MNATEIIRNSHHPCCLGVGGIGLSAVARYFKATSRQVTGFDDVNSVVTAGLEAVGITVHIGPRSQLPSDCDLVIYSDAVPLEHHLRRAATARKLAALSYAQALGGIINAHACRVVVSGTNGKTTTVAMLNSILLADDRDPLVIVGSLSPQLQGNFRLGDGSLAVCEGDDYRGHLLELNPTNALVTNVAMDHPDYFRNLTHVQETLSSFVAKVPPDGCVALNADDASSNALRSSIQAKTETFSVADPAATMFAAPRGIENHEQRFELFHAGTSLGSSRLYFPGEYNLANAAGAALLALQLGVKPPAILEGLKSFRGTWRRFEVVGACRGATIVSDYAHHPDGVRSVIAAARSWYRQHLVVVFQPHHRARLSGLLDQFADALLDADTCIIPEVYHVLGRDEPIGELVSAEALVTAIRERGKSATFAATLDDATRLVKPYLGPGNIILALGAGSIDQWARTLPC